MQYTWFECKVRYAKNLDNGFRKKVTETYVVNALSFSEAEARIIKEMQYMAEEFEISGIKIANFSEVLNQDDRSADRWYKAKVTLITVNENGIEKKTAVYYLVHASAITEAIAHIEDHMSGTIADYEIASVADTDIMDVYPYEEGSANSGDPVDTILPAGQSTEVTIAGKTYVIDKTGRTTKVTSRKKNESSHGIS